MTNSNVKKIVVFAPRFIGDAVNTSSALQILLRHFPNASITMAAHPSLEPIAYRLGCNSFIADNRKVIGSVAGIKTLVRDLRANHFDMAVLFTNTFLPAAIVRLVNIPIRIGYNSESRGWLLTHSLKRNINRHYINSYAYLANSACNNAETLLPEPSLKVEPYELPKSTKKITLAVYFGCEIKAPRYYPEAPTVELIHRLAKSFDVRFIAIGATFEANTTDNLIDKLSSDVEYVNLCGKTSLVQLIDVIDACDGLITIDSSPLHIASALKKPLVVLESQGFSPFSCIQPKSPYSWVASSSWRYIKDEDQVADIPVESIEKAVSGMIHFIESSPAKA